MAGWFHGFKTQTKSSVSSGFTVIEVLIGIGLFGLIMPSIILALVGVARLNDRAGDLTRANILAEQKFESLRSAGYNSLSNGTVSFTNELDSSFSPPKSASYTVTTPTTGVKAIEVSIQYTDQGQSRTISFKSQISELGVAQ